MSRRPKRHDALAEHVAASFLNEDLRELLEAYPILEGYLLAGSIEGLANAIGCSADKVRLELHYCIARFRQFGGGDALASYLYDDESHLERRCVDCRAVLPRHKRGRPPKYCSNACKQRRYRDDGADPEPGRIRIPQELGVEL